MKHFINTIKVETPNKQILMLKEFVQHIRYNLINDVVEIKVAIISPEDSSEIIFSKVFIYFFLKVALRLPQCYYTYFSVVSTTHIKNK